MTRKTDNRPLASFPSEEGHIVSFSYILPSTTNTTKQAPSTSKCYMTLNLAFFSHVHCDYGHSYLTCTI